MSYYMWVFIGAEYLTTSINPSLHTPRFTTITKTPHSHIPSAPFQPRSKSMILNMFEHQILKNDNNCPLAPPPVDAYGLNPQATTW